MQDDRLKGLIDELMTAWQEGRGEVEIREAFAEILKPRQAWAINALDVLTVLATEKPNIPLSGVGYCMFCGADLPREKHDDDCSYVRACELVKEAQEAS